MAKPKNVEYKVVLVFPGFGEERENAEQLLEEALGYLNTQKDEPGMRFAYNVFARLEIVPDVEQAQAKLRTDRTVATMILHDLPEDERDAFTRECVQQGVPVCHTLPAPEPPDATPHTAHVEGRGWTVVIKERSKDDEPRAHKILETTLTASLEGDPEELSDRIGQLIAVLALGVMEHHWTRNPPQMPFLE
jgi:hypothetical protein